MKPKKHIFILVISILFLFSQQSFAQRKVLLEEFTGAWCGWCPYGADIVESILHSKSNVIALAYHQGDPMSTFAGDQLISVFAPAYPQASIDRVVFPGFSKIPISRSLWSQKSLERLDVDPTISISLDVRYNEVTRGVSLTVDLLLLENLNNTQRINVVISEDSLNYEQQIYQQNYTSIYPYYHNNVVREIITGAEGEVLNTSPLTSGTPIQKKYNFSLDSNYKENLSKIVVFVHEDLGGGIGPVQQAEIIDLIPLTTSVEDEGDEQGAVPEAYVLSQNYPNPFNPETNISYSIQKSGLVEVNVYDVTGRLVKNLVRQQQISGTHSIVWNGTNNSGEKVSSGVYFYQLKVGNVNIVRKMQLIK